MRRCWEFIVRRLFYTTQWQETTTAILKANIIARKREGCVIPDNTKASTQWALRNFNDWASNQCFLSPDDPFPNDLLASHDAEFKWLSRFLMETRKTDGSLYPPSSLRSLICGLNRELQKQPGSFFCC